MKNYIALISGMLFSTIVSAGAFTVTTVDGCPTIQNNPVKPAAANTKAPAPTTTPPPKRTLTLDEAVELGVIQAPAKRRAK